MYYHAYNSAGYQQTVPSKIPFSHSENSFRKQDGKEKLVALDFGGSIDP
jgi:hypothetical protein